MCTILLAHQVSVSQPLLVLANRDEFYARPTAAAAEWPEMPGLIAGRDLASGGTWFGARNRRWASITNVREGQGGEAHHKSRGWLVLDYLQSDQHPKAFLRRVASEQEVFAGYNLLLGVDDEIWYASNRADDCRCLGPGIYGLSNHLLDTPWPKVQRGKQAFEALIERDGCDEEAGFTLLADRTLADDDELPETGVPYSWEKALSAIFISMPEYGTRSSTFMSRDANGLCRLTERRYERTPESWQESHFSWRAT